MAGSKELSSFNLLGAEHKYDRKKVLTVAGFLTAAGFIAVLYANFLAIPLLALGGGTLLVTRKNGKKK